MTILTKEAMVQYILDLLEEVTVDYPDDEKGRAQVDILAAVFGGVVVEKNNE